MRFVAAEAYFRMAFGDHVLDFPHPPAKSEPVYKGEYPGAAHYCNFVEYGNKRMLSRIIIVG